MKKIIVALVALTTVFLSSSCQKEISAPKQKHEVHFTVNLSEQTKTELNGTTVMWTDLDKSLFHVFENGVEATDVLVEIQDGIATVTAMFEDSDASEFKYDAFVASLNTNKKPAVLKEQNATSSSYDPAADVLIAQPIVTTDQNESLELKFCFSREVSINKMTLKGIHEGETVKKVTFTGDKSLGGSFDPAKEYSHTPDDKTITINTDSEVVYFVCAPNTVTPTVVVTTDKAAYTKTFSKSITFNKNEFHSFSVNFSDENRTVADTEYTLVTNIDQLSEGDVIVLGCAAKNAAAGVMGAGSFFTSVEATINDGVLKSASAIEILLGKSGDYWTLTTSEGVIGASSAKGLKCNDGTETWTIEVNKDGALIANTLTSCGTIYYNATSPRFLNYTSKQTSIEIYKKCGVPTDVVPVTGVTLNKTEASLEINETLTLVPTVNPDNATNKLVTWSSNNTDVATVENGVVTAVAAGTATITVTTVDGNKTATCEVTVTAPQIQTETYPYVETFASSVGKFSIDNVELSGLTYVWSHDAGYELMKASAFVNKANYETESWLVSPVIDMSSAVNPVLQFDHTYKFGSNATQELTLWVRESGKSWTPVVIEDYGSKDNWNFVTNTISVSQFAGKTLQFAFKYTSSASAAATWEIKNVSVSEAVAPVSVSSVTLDKDAASLTVGDKLTLVATVNPADATDKSVTWSSNNTSVATVSNGIVTAVAAGTATITVTTADGGKTASCVVTVTGGDEGGETGKTIVLDNLGTSITSTSNTEVSTVDITATGTENSYTLNYLQGKKQGNAILLAKSTGAFISNKTPIPGNIKSVTVYINSGASAKTTYYCAFSKTECTEAYTTGSTAVKIEGGCSNKYSCSVSDARYFCISLGNAYNGQVLKVEVEYE